MRQCLDVLAIESVTEVQDPPRIMTLRGSLSIMSKKAFMPTEALHCKMEKRERDMSHHADCKSGRRIGWCWVCQPGHRRSRLYCNSATGIVYRLGIRSIEQQQQQQLLSPFPWMLRRAEAPIKSIDGKRRRRRVAAAVPERGRERRTIEYISTIAWFPKSQKPKPTVVYYRAASDGSDMMASICGWKEEEESLVLRDAAGRTTGT